MRSHIFLLVILVLMVFGGAPSAVAAPIVAGNDFLHNSNGEMTIQILFQYGGWSETIQLIQSAEDAIIHRDLQVGTTINTEILSLKMYGDSNVGPVTVRVGAGMGVVEGPSLGQVTNVVQDPSDPNFATGGSSSFLSGESYFDVLFEIDTVMGTIYNKIPHHLWQQCITQLPPLSSEVYVSPDSFPVYLDVGVLGDHSDDFQIGLATALHHAAPEPATMSLLVLGGMALLRGKRRFGG